MQHFVSECLGVGIVGPVVMVWGISSAVTSFVTGHISVYVTRTALAVVLGGLQSAFAFFQLFWERQPSYYMVFTGAVIQGIIHGIVLPLSTSLYKMILYRLSVYVYVCALVHLVHAFCTYVHVVIQCM